MSKIRLHGTSSGYTEIAPVAASGNNTLTLPNDGTIISKDSNGAVGVTSVVTTTATITTAKVGAAVTISESGIEASGIGITCANINGAQIGGRRNIIINGAMMVAQRGTSETTASGYTTVDRFSQSGSNLANNPDVAQEGLTSGNAYDNGFRKSYKVTNGDNNADSDDQSKINHIIEAQDLANSGWNHKDPNSYATLSFWVKSSVAQTFSVAIYADDANMGYGFEYSATTSWTRITHSIPGHASLGINNDNGSGFNIQWYLYMGTDLTASSFTNADWHTYSGSSRSKDMTTTWQTTNDATFELTGVQLEVGSQATPFEHRSYGDELLLCQRYYQQIAGNTDNVCIGPGRSSGTTTGIFSVPLSVPLRASPTVNSIAWAFFTAANQTNVTATPTVDKWDAVSPVLTCYVSGLSGMTNARCLSAYSNSANTFTIDAEL